MPIYEYRCAACGHQQEFLQKVGDPPMSVCTKCGKTAFEKMVTAAGFQLKGSGWYATDFKNSGSKPATSVPPPKTSSDAKPAADSKPAGDSKPASDSSSSTSTSTPAPTPPVTPSR